jgi:hypothetical protein
VGRAAIIPSGSRASSGAQLLRLRALLVCVAASLGGCAARTVAPQGEPRAPSAHADAPGFGHGLDQLASAAQGVQFFLPGALSWQVRDGARTGLVATHAATHSRLAIRAFRDTAIGGAERCEAQARAADRTLPSLAGEVIERRHIALAPDFELALVVTVAAEEAEGPALGEPVLRGHALAFGGDGRRCLAVTFSTAAQGPRADALVAERLGLIVESTFARMRLRSIDQRVQSPRL